MEEDGFRRKVFLFVCLFSFQLEGVKFAPGVGRAGQDASLGAGPSLVKATPEHSALVPRHLWELFHVWISLLLIPLTR